MYFNRRCKITFICHGATIYSEEGRFSDSTNYPPLSDLGVEEMDNVVKFLKYRAVKTDAIYSSPSERTVQSAAMISKLFKKEYEILDDLTSRKYGVWNGLTYSQILDNYPNGFQDMLLYPQEKMPSNGESSIDFIERTQKVINNLVENNIGNRIIVVTHPEVIQAAVCAALEINAGKLPKIYIRTGSLTQISYFENWSSLVYSDHVPI